MSDSETIPLPGDGHDARRRRTLRGTARWSVRVACLAGGVALLWPTGWTEQDPALVPALSPWVATASMLATRSVHALAWLGLAVGGVALVRRRWFCRWACPMGVCADAASGLGRRLRRRSRKLGPWGAGIAWVTLGGAALGFPVFLWLDPLALFAGLFRLGEPGAGIAAWFNRLGLACVLLLSFTWPHAWCGQVCPLGAFQDALFAPFRLIRSRVRPATSGERSPREWGPPLVRRTVLGAGVGVVWAVATRWARADTPRPLRPPGARDEPAFLGVCLRCGNCARVCPTRIVVSDLGSHGIASFMTPLLRFENDYCREDCTRCTDVCPSGALARISQEEKPHVRIGVPHVDMDICLLGEDRECSACRSHCPYEAVRYVFSEIEYALTPQIDASRCNGCGACEVACPTTPTKAIVVRPGK